VTKTATTGLAMLAGFIILLAVASVLFVEFDRDGLVGAGISTALGLINLVIGSWVTMRSLKRNMKSAMRTLMVGFFVRLIAVATLVVVFQRTDAVDAVAFALAFMLFFFFYLGLEVYLVEKSLNGSRRPA